MDEFVFLTYDFLKIFYQVLKVPQEKIGTVSQAVIKC